MTAAPTSEPVGSGSPSTDPSAPTSPSAATTAGALLRTPVRVALLVLVLGTLFAGARLAAHDGDPSAFVSAGDRLTRPEQAPELTVKPDSLGYDGQFFHRLARNPLTRDAREFGTRLDRPAYRHQRIAYPAAVWLVTGGRAALVPWALVGVNLLALGAVGLLAAQLAVDAGRPAWWGLIVAGWPGLLVALSYDLSEVMAASLLLAAVLALRRERWLWATVALTVAALTRETTLVLAAGIVGAVVLRHLHRLGRGPLRRLADRTAGPGDPVPLVVGLVPIAVTAAFRVALERWWDGVGSVGPDIPSFVGVPLWALVRQVGRWVTEGDVVGYYLLFQVAVVVAVLIALARLLLDPEVGRPHERLGLLGALLVLSMVPVWDRSVVFLRWPDEAVALGFALAVSAPRFPVGPVLRGVGALAVTTALVWAVI